MANAAFQEYNLKYKRSSDADEKDEGAPILSEAPLTGMYKSLWASYEASVASLGSSVCDIA